MGVDAVEVAQHVEVARTCLQAVDATVAPGFQMSLRRLFPHPANPDHTHLHLINHLAGLKSQVTKIVRAIHWDMISAVLLKF
ncbi:hypothetical protein LCM4579_23030 [Ensifer sp. LCM 4579]|nr:hypothetical protein LCM4579_23030 [Ensifer sp. LCM 4579]